MHASNKLFYNVDCCSSFSSLLSLKCTAENDVVMKSMHGQFKPFTFCGGRGGRMAECREGDMVGSVEV